MKKIGIICILLSSLILTSYSQNDSLKKEILNYPDPKSEIIAKGRQMILDKFLEKDKSKVKEVLNYLTTEVEDMDYFALIPEEKILLYYWTEQYDKIFNEQTKIDSFYLNIYQMIIPKNDLLSLKLWEQLNQQKINIYYQIQHSPKLNDEGKSFLILNFDNLIRGSNSENNIQEMDTLNKNATNFLQSYPHSKYNKYVRRFVRSGYKPSNWGLVWEFFSGYGIFSGNLEEKFTNNVPIGIDFDICYKNIVLYLRDFIGFNNTKDSIPFKSATWEKNTQVRVFLPEASIGYVSLKNKRLMLTPFIGISSTSLTPTDYDKKNTPDYKNVGLDFTTTYTFGINLDVKLGKLKNTKLTFRQEKQYLFIRLRYAYNMPQFDHKYSGFNGNMHYITIGIGQFGRSFR